MRRTLVCFFLNLALLFHFSSHPVSAGASVWKDEQRQFDRYYYLRDRQKVLEVALPFARKGNPYAMKAVAFGLGFVWDKNRVNPPEATKYLKDALLVFESLSANGDIDALKELEFAYRFGYGGLVAVSAETANRLREKRFKLLLMSAESGDGDAAAEIAECYQKGPDEELSGGHFFYHCGVERNFSKATEWARNSIAAGSLDGEYRLADILRDRDNPFREEAEGLKLLMSLADRNVAEAVLHLVRSDYVADQNSESPYMSDTVWKAKLQGWLLQSADSPSDIRGQLEVFEALGDAFEGGMYGFEKNLSFAYMYYEMSGWVQGVLDKNRFRKKMNEGEKARAEYLVRECRSRNYLQCSVLLTKAREFEFTDTPVDDTIIKPNSSGYEKCFLDHIGSVGGANSEALFEIRRACASQFEVDITKQVLPELDVRIRNDDGFGNIWVNNSSALHITSICIWIREEGTEKRSSYCGRVSDAFRLQQVLLGAASPDLATIAPRSAGLFHMYIKGVDDPEFWKTRSWWMKSVRGF